MMMCWTQLFEAPLATAKYSVLPSSCMPGFVIDLTLAAVSLPTFTQRSRLDWILREANGPCNPLGNFLIFYNIFIFSGL